MSMGYIFHEEGNHTSFFSSRIYLEARLEGFEMLPVDKVQEEEPLKKAELEGDGEGEGHGANLVETIENGESDKDSYSGYDDSSSDFSDDEERKEYRRYCKQIARSDGFDLDFDPTFRGEVGGIRRLEYFEGGYVERVNMCLEETVRKNNEGGLKFLSDIVADPNLVCQFVDDKLLDPVIVKANVAGSAMLYYITFEATSAKSGNRKVYQVELMDDRPDDERVIFLLREKPGQS